MEWTGSEELLRRAEKVVAGGVNSNVRLVSLPRPLYFDRGDGPRVIDVDGNTYLDYVLGQGPLILGHRHPQLTAAIADVRDSLFAAQHVREIELAELICGQVPCAERIRLGSSGSEVVQAALRLARAKTGRPKILKFEGHYHGWFDNVLISVAPPLTAAGPRSAPAAVPGSRGQCAAALDDVIVLPWNDAPLLEQTLRSRVDEIAAVITEPIMCNVGCILPRPGYLRRMRELCDELGIVLIFDEIITGFRVRPGGAQQLYGVTPDLATFGKALAGGMPIACLAGRAGLMNLLCEGVNHSGTYNANVMVVAGALACQRAMLARRKRGYRTLQTTGRRLRDGIRHAARELGLPIQVQGPGPMFHVAFADRPLRDYRSATRADTGRYHRFALELLKRNVRVIERGIWYVSAVHTDEDIEATLAAVRAAFAEVR